MKRPLAGIHFIINFVILNTIQRMSEIQTMPKWNARELGFQTTFWSFKPNASRLNAVCTSPSSFSQFRVWISDIAPKSKRLETECNL